ncbi:hypothetical protein SMICM304S_00770 [Streptomyces microflavus]
MADEQDEWLDKDAAEKLLRGEPVVPLGDRARDDALRLAEALGAARAVRRAPAGELPGEDAVLTAFRQATRAGGDRLAGRSAGAALPGQPGTLHSVHIGAAPAAPPRRPRWSRPVRFGLAVSLAGCALGGVAVAAGTGVLPGPFGGNDSPAPASSVSAATPEPLVSGLPAEDPSAAAEPSPPADPDPVAPPRAAGPAPPRSPPTRSRAGPARRRTTTVRGRATAPEARDARTPPRAPAARMSTPTAPTTAGTRAASGTRSPSRPARPSAPAPSTSGADASWSSSPRARRTWSASATGC